MLEVVMMGKVLRYPYKIRSFLEFVWHVFEGSSYVMLYIPRVRVGIYLVDPVCDLVVGNVSWWYFEP